LSTKTEEQSATHSAVPRHHRLAWPSPERKPCGSGKSVSINGWTTAGRGGSRLMRPKQMTTGPPLARPQPSHSFWQHGKGDDEGKSLRSPSLQRRSSHPSSMGMPSAASHVPLTEASDPAKCSRGSLWRQGLRFAVRPAVVRCASVESPASDPKTTENGPS
jgi:hypothetical protein